MPRSSEEIRIEIRELAWLLTQLAARAAAMSSSEFAGVWRTLEPRLLACLRQSEAEEGAASRSLERLRNLTWEVAVTAELKSLHCAALQRLAKLFDERAGQWPGGASSREDTSPELVGLFGIG
jgi:hypothetical protein